MEAEKKQWLERHGIAYDGECARGKGQAAPTGRRRRCEDFLSQLPASEQFRFEKHFNRQVQSCLDRGLGECHLREAACVRAVREQLFGSTAAVTIWGIL